MSKSLTAVILAGGKGTRLKPFTVNFPKPLMPVNDKPILEIIIRQLCKNNFKEIIIAIGHMGEMIRLYFQDGRKFGVNITYSSEDHPLGTAGPLFSLKDSLKETFLLMNGDVLADINFNDMLEFHKQNRDQATIGLAKRMVHVDFGVVDLNEMSEFQKWTEKPDLEYLVSMGIYFMEPEVIAHIPPGKFFNLPDLIVKLKKDKQKVKGFLHNGYWLDIGRPEDYEKACNEFENLKL
ncbi:MAG: sugar phosphate nucleotidyltransferase [Thermodesulfovibrionales bacterium]|nr:sugar phosphate nucleotidyltransferase [Thermodesulfovibrionales bacterium]